MSSVIDKMRCSSVVRAVTHGVMGHWINLKKVMVCAILSVSWCI